MIPAPVLPQHPHCGPAALPFAPDNVAEPIHRSLVIAGRFAADKFSKQLHHRLLPAARSRKQSSHWDIPKSCRRFLHRAQS
jgi:hypothetical protein